MNHSDDTTPNSGLGFLKELRRRKVVRVGLAYLAAAWLLMQVVDVVGPALELPDWSVRLVLLLLAAGLPVVVLLAWAFELTPEGIKTTGRARKEFGEAQQETAIQRRRNLLAYATGAAGAALLIGVSFTAGLLWSRWSSSTDPDARTTTPTSQPTITVSAFSNLSGRSELDWLGEGIATLMRGHLARSRHLIVVSKTRWDSILRTPADRSNPHAAALEAGIEYVLSGEILSGPNGLILAYKVSDVQQGIDIFARTFDGMTQEEVVLSVDQLSMLTKQVLGVPFKNQVDSFAADFVINNFAAYRSYVSGLEYFVRLEYVEAQRALETALQLAPDFHMARYRLAFVHWVTGRRKEASETLARIPSDAPVSHRERLYIDGARAFLVDRDYERAISLYQALLRELPHEVEARQYLAEVYFHSYKEDLAIAELKQLAAQEPENGDVWSTLATYLTATGSYSEALAAAQEYARVGPDGPNTHSTLGQVLQHMGDYASAEEHYRRALELDARFVPAQLGIAAISAALGDIATASALWNEIVRDENAAPQHRIAAAFDRAWILRAQGDCSQSLATLDLVGKEIREEHIRVAMELELRAKCRADLGEFAVAKALFKRAIELAPSAPTGFLFARGQFEIERGDLDTALSTASEIRRYQLPSDNPDRTEEKAAAYLDGLVALATGNTDEAIRHFRQSLETQGYRYAIYELGLAQALLGAGRIREALAFAVAAKNDRDPGDFRFDLERERVLAQTLEERIVRELRKAE